MRWIPRRHAQRPRRGGVTLVDSGDGAVPPEPPGLPPRDPLQVAALLAARVHVQGGPVHGAVSAAATLSRAVAPGHPRRHEIWLLQGLYHRLASCEVEPLARGDSSAAAHAVRAEGVLRLAATSPDRAVRRRATAALQRQAVQTAARRPWA